MLRKRIFYIDFENTGIAGLMGLESLSAKDELVILYTAKANSLTFDVHRGLMTTPAKVRLIKAIAGTPNALDFQLASLLGYDVKRCGNRADYFIISKDKGYTPLPFFWASENGASVIRAETISGKPLPKKAKGSIAKPLGPIIEVERATKGLNLNKGDIVAISGYIAQYRSKANINNALVKRFNSKRGGQVYRAIKPLITNAKSA